jgi:hypothetical protein
MAVYVIVSVLSSLFLSIYSSYVYGTENSHRKPYQMIREAA